MTLGSLCKQEPDYGVSASSIERTDENQPKYIRITDFSDDGIEENHIFTAPSDYLPKHILHENDILFARTGSVGRTFLYKSSLGLAVFAGYCIRFSIDESKALPQYVYWYTKTSQYARWVQKLQRPSVQSNINKEEYKSLEIPLPSVDKQARLVADFERADARRAALLHEVNELLADLDGAVFERLGIQMPALNSRLIYSVRRKDISGSEIFCRPTYPAYKLVLDTLRNSKFYKGSLEEFIAVNPKTDSSMLSDTSIVSFVPMTAVGNRDNTVEYEDKEYREVKTGYTVFQRGDLLWAKITPCMQNGKSCIVDTLPTDIGFGSTEFHVLRSKGKNIHLPYIWCLLSSRTFLTVAQAVFTGSAGQQRVSDTILKKLPLPLPDIDTQKKIALEVFTKRDKALALKNKAAEEWATARARFEKELLGE